MEKAYTIGQRRSSASAVRNKRYLDKKLRFVHLQPHDRVLLRNLSERGGPGKLRAFCEKDVNIVVLRKDPLSPLYEVKRETGKGSSLVLHRNLLLLCNDLPIERPTPAHRSDMNARQRRNRKSRVPAQLQSHISPTERTIVEEDSSSSSGDEVIVIMQSENPSGGSQETTWDNSADHSSSNSQENEVQCEHNE